MFHPPASQPARRTRVCVCVRTCKLDGLLRWREISAAGKESQPRVSACADTQGDPLAPGFESRQPAASFVGCASALRFASLLSVGRVNLEEWMEGGARLEKRAARAARL